MEESIESKLKRLEEYDKKLSEIMPDDFKDWHANSKAEWPSLAAWVIQNYREREEQAWSLVAILANGHIPKHDPAKRSVVDQQTDRDSGSLINGASADCGARMVFTQYDTVSKNALISSIANILHAAHARDIDPVACLLEALKTFVEDAT